MRLVAAAALGAAVAIYQLGCLVNQMIQGFMVDSPAPGDIQPPRWSAPRPSSSRTAE